MTEIKIKEIVENLINTFLLAGKISIELREKGLIKKLKSDNTPVSNGDLEVNKILTKTYYQRFNTNAIRGLRVVLLFIVWWSPTFSWRGMRVGSPNTPSASPAKLFEFHFWQVAASDGIFQQPIKNDVS